jgi:hypothetical protein
MLSTRPRTPTLDELLGPAPRRGRLGLTPADLDEALYALELRRDTLGTGALDDDARGRLDRVTAALELELARIL